MNFGKLDVETQPAQCNFIVDSCCLFFKQRLDKGSLAD